MNREVVVLWSGGIDSTALLGALLASGFRCKAVSLDFDGMASMERESAARAALVERFADRGWAASLECREGVSGSFLWEFSSSSSDITWRNKRMLDHLVEVHCRPEGIFTVGMGEYVGCDTWVVRDHVGAMDCDARSLSAYLLSEYGLNWRLMTLSDFGEARYKVDRVRIGLHYLGEEVMLLTTNCLHGGLLHCGDCYKCVERAVAFNMLGVDDTTEYAVDPRRNSRWDIYCAQMRGEDVSSAYQQAH